MSSLFCSGRTWFRLYTDTTAWEMREKKRLQMSSCFVSDAHGSGCTRTPWPGKCGRKEGYKCRRFVPGDHGSGCTQTPRPKKCGRKNGNKCRRCFVNVRASKVGPDPYSYLFVMYGSVKFTCTVSILSTGTLSDCLYTNPRA
jgi:hypothetical protein